MENESAANDGERDFGELQGCGHKDEGTDREEENDGGENSAVGKGTHSPKRELTGLEAPLLLFWMTGEER